MKRCSKCEQEYPRTLEYFPPRKDSKDGLLGRCRICQKGYGQKRYANNEAITKSRASKRYAENRDSILERMRVQYWDNPDKFRKKANTYYHEHKEIILPRNRRYREINAGKVNAQKRIWRISNPEAYRLSIARSKAKKPDVYDTSKKVVAQRRRAKIRQLPSNFTTQDWQRAVEYFNGCCAVCGRPPGLWHKLAMDHWVAISNPTCPGTVPTNIVPLCDKMSGCNQSKGDKDATEWLERKYGKRKAKVILDRINTYFRSLTE